MVWAELGTLIGVPVVRSIAGWIENAFEDGKVDRFEVGKLGSTVLRVGIMGAAAFFGLEAFGLDVSAFAAATSAVVLDFILGVFREKA
jgi:hypothetical protein